MFAAFDPGDSVARRPYDTGKRILRPFAYFAHDLDSFAELDKQRVHVARLPQSGREG